MKILKYSLLAIVYSLLIWSSCQVVSRSARATQFAAEVNSFATVDEKIDTELKNLLDAISFGIYDGGEEKLSQIDAALIGLEQNRNKAHNFALFSLILSSAFLTFIYFFYRENLFVHLLTLSVISLAVGLITPVLSFTAFQEIPLLGQVVFRHDSKGILATVKALFGTHKYFVAVIITVFSLFVPIAKIGTFSLLPLLATNSTVAKFARFFHRIGKWSMLDVFVVAVFLALFAMNQDGLTDASAGIGLYYFAAYVFLSMFAGQIWAQNQSSTE